MTKSQIGRLVCLTCITCAAGIGVSSQDFDFVQEVGTISDLVALVPREDRINVWVNGRKSANDGGGGLFCYLSASAVNTNEGTIFESKDGVGRWCRKYAGPINICWFGACGDGVTDETSAIVSALALGGPVHFPKGTYVVSQQLLVKSNQSISGSGPGGTIVRVNALFDFAKNVFQVSATNSSISDLSIDGNGRALAAISFRANSTTGSVRNCDLYNCRKAGVEAVENASDLTVSGNRIYNISGAHGTGVFLFSGVQRCTVANNIIGNCQDYHVLIDGGTDGGTNTPCQENIITDNTISTTTSKGWGIGIEGSHRNVVCGNSMFLTNSSYAIVVDGDNAIGNTAPTGNVVSGNRILSSGSGVRVSGKKNLVSFNNIVVRDAGIIVANAGSIPHEIVDLLVANNSIGGPGCGGKRGIQIDRGIGLTISNNQISGAGDVGVMIGEGQQIDIQGNIIKNSAKEGILAASKVINLRLVGNRVIDAGMSSPGSYAAISISVTSATTVGGLIVADNTADHTQPVAKVKAGIEIVGKASGFANHKIVRNRVLRADVPALLMDDR